ncbi:unnamed protein product, partial [Strongylus vulgaris]
MVKDWPIGPKYLVACHIHMPTTRGCQKLRKRFGAEKLAGKHEIQCCFGFCSDQYLVHSRTTCVVNRRLKGLGEEGPDSYRIRAKPLNPAHDSNLQKFLHAQRLDIQQRYEEIFDEQSYDRIRQWEKLKHGIIPTQQK